jgi:hypothetical protein
MERIPTVAKAIEDRRLLECWEWMLDRQMPYLKRSLAIQRYTGNPDPPEVMADDYMEFEIMVLWKMAELHPIGPGYCWPGELTRPVRIEVNNELILRWYGARRTPDEEKEIDQISEQLNKDFDAGVPSEQSEAAAYFRRWYEQHPRLNYQYVELRWLKPEGWQWPLEELEYQG